MIGDWLYVVGGFERMRVMIASVVKVNLVTQEEVDCCPLPCPAFKLALTSHKDNLKAFHRGSLLVYSPQSDSWSTTQINTDIPANIEFHSAINLCNIIYLTSSYSRSIYSVSLENQAEVKKVGEFVN